MNDLIDSIKELQQGEIRELISQRISEFSQYKEEHINEIFKELCFCVMTANCGAEKCIEIHEQIGLDFVKFSETELSNRFKELGYRFPNIRAQYINESKKKIDELKIALRDLEGEELRKWIVKNIKGLGYKESSHFLRNIGYKNYAIIDFHIADLLEKYQLIEKPKTMTKTKYIEIEEILKDLGERLSLNMAELDLYLWYMETGKILK
ncbi:MAG: N-glycosylase/DNA lyase [Candidatus Lokiarchaeota archaeon]|nr:N-glycosylase/DNA lyase [Candidatus Lokiarchaeota archaeon]MBD3202005.1 N-glycosylase/DNA lyase [Candidatus Lokiarchaeota archaeon]